MIRQPEIYTANRRELNEILMPDGRYVPARPKGHNIYPIKHRFITAFNVLIGKYDALKWIDKIV